MPTDNTEVCDFCLTYEPPTDGSLLVDRPFWLVAQGDASSVHVYRSPLVKPGKRMFEPVAEYIAEHGLSLVYAETDEDPEWIHGKRIREIYS
ncbi:hypothetical protein [Mycolicibacterium conceptionense]|uniref:hypothetical protein n=1 Tax=Mycolicibacterium conceptionense TaxID=451644 RepID=UPI001A9780A9|nr:hypothetical protein [Mycolicibacterium conceptionense]